MSQEEKDQAEVEQDTGPKETKVSASVRYFSELGDKKRKKLRYIMALNSEDGPIHFYAKYLNQSEGLKKAKLEKSLIRVSPEGLSWVKVGGNDKKRLKPEAIEAAFKEATVHQWQTIITWDTHPKLEEFRVIFKNANADLKKEEEERKKKEEAMKKQQSKLRILQTVPIGCTQYRFKSEMFKEISDCVNETIMTIQRTKGLAQVDLEPKDQSDEDNDKVTEIPKLPINEGKRRNRSASLGSKDDASMPNSARSAHSNASGQASNLAIPQPRKKHRNHDREEFENNNKENIFTDTYHPNTNNDMMSSYIPMADTFGGF